MLAIDSCLLDDDTVLDKKPACLKPFIL